MPRNPSLQRPFRHSLRFKLLLVSLTLVVIPWAGYRTLQETEAFLREGQEEMLLGTARTIAALLHDRNDLFPLGVTDEPSLYVHTLSNAIRLDGYTEDWSTHLRNSRRFSSVDTPPEKAPSLAFDLLLGQNDRHLYALFQVEDDRLVYSLPGNGRLDRSDHLQITLEHSGGSPLRYLIATSAPGWVSGYRLPDEPDTTAPPMPESRIKGEWQETLKGYNLEIRIPRDLINERVRFTLADVDAPESRQTVATVSTAPTPGRLVTPSRKIREIIRGLEHEDTRIWVIDRSRQVLAQLGRLKNPEKTAAPDESLSSLLLHGLLRLVLRRPTAPFDDKYSGTSLLRGAEIDAALENRPESRRRNTADKEAVILSAAWPVRTAEGVLGAVVVERSTHAIQSMQNQALERLITVTLIFFIGTGLVLFGFASLLTARIRRLHHRVESAVTPDGRIRGTLDPGRARDEIGDLGRSFTGVLNRLGEYNRYLETMASRLAHELRTPLAVMRTSLENLETAPEPEARERYLKRAKQGAERLGLILHRMREATRLEQLLQQTEMESFDLAELIQQAAESYRSIYPDVQFETELAEGETTVTGAPDLICQALDKLVGNAVDFHTSDTPVLLRLEQQASGHLGLSVGNAGPPLPQGLRQELFESMVSIRPDTSGEPHLGLGLYLVRLICQFHDGWAQADNLPDNSGVIFTLMLPKSK